MTDAASGWAYVQSSVSRLGWESGRVGALRGSRERTEARGISKCPHIAIHMLSSLLVLSGPRVMQAKETDSRATERFTPQ